MKTQKETPVAVAVALLSVALLFFLVNTVGNIAYIFEDASFTVHTRLWADRTVDYAEIESAELRDSFDVGTRSSGYGSGKLMMGLFRNTEFGGYHLYAYTASEAVVILHLQGEDILVLSAEDSPATQELYKRIENRPCSVQ